MTNDAPLPGDDTPDLTMKTLQYDPAIYQKETLTPEDLQTLHDRADGLVDHKKLDEHVRSLELDKVKAEDIQRIKDFLASAPLPANGQVDVSVDVSTNCPIHCSYFPGAKTADFNVPVTVLINGIEQRGSISKDLTIPEALYLKSQLEDFVRNFVLRVLQP